MPWPAGSRHVANTFRPRGKCCHLVDSWLVLAAFRDILRRSVVAAMPSFVDLRPLAARLTSFAVYLTGKTCRLHSYPLADQPPFPSRQPTYADGTCVAMVTDRDRR